jgi:dihydrofolate synthase/folylpolyglutamate synthase
MRSRPPESASFDWLDALRVRGVRLGLPPVRALCAELGDPQDAVPSILIAGTNGKGSVAAMIEAGLRRAGRRTGLYTSPHLRHVRERYRIRGQIPDDARIESALAQVREASERLEDPPTYFEATTAAAFVLFRSEGCDTCILEVGMGGRLDATNIVAMPTLSVITRITHDHMDELGTDLAGIAREKAGILRAGGRAVIGAQDEPAATALREAAESAGALLTPAEANARLVENPDRTLRLETPRHTLNGLRPSLAGAHQQENIQTAAAALLELEAADGVWSEEPYRAAVEDARLEGRLDWRLGDPDVLLDGAHNPSGARALADYLESEGIRPVLLFGCMRDKQFEEMLGALAPLCREIVLTAVENPRALDPVLLLAHTGDRLCSTARPVSDAFAVASARARALGVPLLVAGSLYLVGDVLELVST